MGNQLAQPQKLQPEHLAELPKVVMKDSLGKYPWLRGCLVEIVYCFCFTLIHFLKIPGNGRFLKTVSCVHDDGGLVVVKVSMYVILKVSYNS